jgi:hypothetical protein
LLESWLKSCSNRVDRTGGKHLANAILLHCNTPKSFPRDQTLLSWVKKWRVAQTPGENITITILLHCNTAQKVFQEIKPYSAGERRTSPSPSYCTATLPKKFSKRSNPTQRGKGEHRHHHPTALQHCPKSFPRDQTLLSGGKKKD